MERSRRAVGLLGDEISKEGLAGIGEGRQRPDPATRQVDRAKVTPGDIAYCGIRGRRNRKVREARVMDRSGVERGKKGRVDTKEKKRLRGWGARYPMKGAEDLATHKEGKGVCGTVRDEGLNPEPSKPV